MCEGPTAAGLRRAERCPPTSAPGQLCSTLTPACRAPRELEQLWQHPGGRAQCWHIKQVPLGTFGLRLTGRSSKSSKRTQVRPAWRREAQPKALLHLRGLRCLQLLGRPLPAQPVCKWLGKMLRLLAWGWNGLARSWKLSMTFRELLSCCELWRSLPPEQSAPAALSSGHPTGA